eukprot:scaffold649_cov347-Pavlova_lutheri.AAC.102
MGMRRTIYLEMCQGRSPRRTKNHPRKRYRPSHSHFRLQTGTSRQVFICHGSDSARFRHEGGSSCTRVSYHTEGHRKSCRTRPSTRGWDPEVAFEPLRGTTPRRYQGVHPPSD